MRFWEKVFWPSNSTNLNPFDNIWPQDDAKFCARPHNSITALKENIKQALMSFEKSENIRAVFKYRKHVEDGIMTAVGYI